MRRILLFLLLLTSCHKKQETPISYACEQFSGRDEGPFKRESIYRAKVPLTWQRIYNPEEESVSDTKKPIATLRIPSLEGDILITVHSFPAASFGERIPPAAQLDRWKRQLGETLYAQSEEASFGGFAGLLFEGANEDKAILALAMQLDMEHFQLLSFYPGTPEAKARHKQMQADYTIKAIGPKHAIAEKKEEILFFAHSFELIDPIIPRG